MTAVIYDKAVVYLRWLIMMILSASFLPFITIPSGKESITGYRLLYFGHIHAVDARQCFGINLATTHNDDFVITIDGFS